MDFADGSAVRLTIAGITHNRTFYSKPYSKGNEAYFKESESRFEMENV
jgi:carboxyl-terminal processing protease